MFLLSVAYIDMLPTANPLLCYLFSFNVTAKKFLFCWMIVWIFLTNPSYQNQILPISIWWNVAPVLFPLSNYIKHKYNPSFYRIINHWRLMFKIKSPSCKNRQETGYLIWFFLPRKFNFKIRFYNCHRSSYKEVFIIPPMYSM